MPGQPGSPGFLAIGARLRGNPLGSRVGEADEGSELALEASGVPRNPLVRAASSSESTHTNVRRASFCCWSLESLSPANVLRLSGRRPHRPGRDELGARRSAPTAG